ncbi:PAS domain-containing sensor histidine kinase [Desulfatitalea alkaliphila]|uniref:PAS domain S-box protein n=1 Tax=Desulfatitalea alkaliphila TaxID=2929485 RepID=A0AA41R0J2_9BACT|nr:PAS domain S-box protein [Desulfatitalea alkaliphila]MCJ8499689.1 PAS domain S-box protein [Desulfatitalea alkaliphila]
MQVDTDMPPSSPWERLQTLLRHGPADDLLEIDPEQLGAILEENDRLFKAMVDAFEGLIYICSADYRIEFLNDRMIRHLGHDATGELCYEAFGRRSVCPWCINHRITKGETVTWELISPRDMRWYYVLNAPIRHLDGTVSKYAMMMDIHERKKNEEELRNHRGRLEERIKARTAELTEANEQLRQEIEERKQAEEAMRRSEAKYRELVQNANSIIIRFDTRGVIRFFNEYAQQFFGYTEQEILGRTLWETILPTVDSTGRRITSMVDAFLTRPEQFKTDELENRRRNGERVWVAWTNRPILDADGKIAEFLCVGVDVTERRQNRRRIRTLTYALLKAQENERARIARDLHDHIAQDLSSLKIRLQTLFANESAAGNDAQRQTEETLQILQRSISEVRNLAYDLRPPGLDQFGLVRTLFLYCEDFAQQNGLKIDFIAAGLDDLALGEDIQINIYRLIQEALHNVKKHAAAKGVTIRLVASSPNLILRIVDDGKGFDIDHWRDHAYQEKRMGLQSMVERVGLLDGTIDIRSRPGKGAGIFITIPIKEQLSGGETAHSDH